MVKVSLFKIITTGVLKVGGAFATTLSITIGNVPAPELLTTSLTKIQLSSLCRERITPGGNAALKTNKLTLRHNAAKRLYLIKIRSIIVIESGMILKLILCFGDFP